MIKVGKYTVDFTWWCSPRMWEWSIPQNGLSYRTIEAGPLQLEWWPTDWRKTKVQLLTLVEGQELSFDDAGDHDDYLEHEELRWDAEFEDFLRTQQITLGEFLRPESTEGRVNDDND